MSSSSSEVWNCNFVLSSAAEVERDRGKRPPTSRVIKRFGISNIEELLNSQSRTVASYTLESMRVIGYTSVDGRLVCQVVAVYQEQSQLKILAFPSAASAAIYLSHFLFPDHSFYPLKMRGLKHVLWISF